MAREGCVSPRYIQAVGRRFESCRGRRRLEETGRPSLFRGLSARFAGHAPRVDPARCDLRPVSRLDSTADRPRPDMQRTAPRPLELAIPFLGPIHQSQPPPSPSLALTTGMDAGDTDACIYSGWPPGGALRPHVLRHRAAARDCATGPS